MVKRLLCGREAVFRLFDESHEVKKNLHLTRGTTTKVYRVAGPSLLLAPGQHSLEETSQRWRAVDDTVPI